MTDQVFLRLYGENASGQRVVYEARLEGVAIKERLCNRATGKEEPAGTGVKYYRIALFTPEDKALLTIFDLLPQFTGDKPVELEGSSKLKIRDLTVRFLLPEPPT